MATVNKLRTSSIYVKLSVVLATKKFKMVSGCGNAWSSCTLTKRLWSVAWKRRLKFYRYIAQMDDSWMKKEEGNSVHHQRISTNKSTLVNGHRKWQNVDPMATARTTFRQTTNFYKLESSSPTARNLKLKRGMDKKKHRHIAQGWNNLWSIRRSRKIVLLTNDSMFFLESDL